MIPDILYCPIESIDFIFHSTDFSHRRFCLYDSYELAFNSLAYPVVMTIDANAMVADGIALCKKDLHCLEINGLDNKYIKERCYLGEYDELRCIDAETKIARSNGCYSILDAYNNELASYINHIESFNDGWALAREYAGDTLVYLIDKKGKRMTVNGQYINWAEPMNNGRAIVRTGTDEHYVVDCNGRVLTPCFSVIERMRKDGNIAYVLTDDSLGLLDINTCQYIIPCKYNRFEDRIHMFDEKNSIVVVAEKYYLNEEDPDEDDFEMRYHFYTFDGKTAQDYFSEYEEYHNLFLVRVCDMWGCINSNVEYIVKPSCLNKEAVVIELEEQN